MCVQCKNLRWERENIGSYTWTFVLPAQPTDERKGRGWGRGGEGGGSEGEGKKVHEGMERKEETQESEREKNYFWSCERFVQRFGEYHTLLCLRLLSALLWLANSFSFLFFKISDGVEDLTTFLLHLNATPHTQYASMNKLTLRTRTLKIAAHVAAECSCCWSAIGAGFQLSPQRGWDRYIIYWLLDSRRTSQIRVRGYERDFTCFYVCYIKVALRGVSAQLHFSSHYSFLYFQVATFGLLQRFSHIFFRRE